MYCLSLVNTSSINQYRERERERGYVAFICRIFYLTFIFGFIAGAYRGMLITSSV